MKGVANWIWIVGGVVISLIFFSFFVKVVSDITLENHRQSTMESFDMLVSQINSFCEKQTMEKVTKKISLSGMVGNLYASDDGSYQTDLAGFSHGDNLCIRFKGDLKCEHLLCDFELKSRVEQKKLLNIVEKTTGIPGFNDYEFTLEKKDDIVRMYAFSVGDQKVTTSEKSKLGIQTQFLKPGVMKFIEETKPTVVKLICCYDRASEIKQKSPETFIVGRIHQENQQTDGDPEYKAEQWFNQHRSTIEGTNDVDCWEGYNEPVPGHTKEEMEWISAFEVKRIELLNSIGRKACIGSFSAGNPDINNPEAWPAFRPALEAAKQYGGYLSLHEYCHPSMKCQLDGDAGWLTLRYRKVYNEYLKPNGLGIDLVITETGIDSGGCEECGWRSHTDAESYLNDLIWYDSNIREDDYVIGAAIYHYGLYGWESFEIYPDLTGNDGISGPLVEYMTSGDTEDEDDSTTTTTDVGPSGECPYDSTQARFHTFTGGNPNPLHQLLTVEFGREVKAVGVHNQDADLPPPPPWEDIKLEITGPDGFSKNCDVECRFTPPSPGEYTLRATSTDGGGSKCEDQATLTVLGEGETTTTTIPSSTSDFCVHAEIDSTGDDFAIDKSKEMGAGWIKQLFQWSYVQPNNKDEWDWSTFDQWYSKANSADIKIIPRLHGAPGWVHTEGINEDWGNRPDLDKFDEFANFAAEFVKRYNPKYVEIWNEPNFIAEWDDNGPNPGQFADLMKEVKQKFDSEGLNVKIILGGLGSTYTNGNMNEFDFIRGCYEADSNFGDYYDILGHHPYGYQQPPGHECSSSDDPNSQCFALDRVRLLYDYVKNNWGEKPIMITEFGWWLDWVDEKTQGEYLYKSYEKIDSDYPFVENSCWWILSDNSKWDHTGTMFRSTDGSPRPAYYCYQSLTGKSSSHPYTDICPPKFTEDVIYFENTVNIDGNNYKRLNLDNGNIIVSFIPELGGRIYEFINKKTGNNQFYNNPVRKPVGNWGENDCRPEGNWEAIGGIEFSFPTEEHGGIWDREWNYEKIDNGDDSKTIRLSHILENCNKQELNGLEIQIEVTVFPTGKYFEIKSTILNPTSDAKEYQYWINAMLTPGGTDPLNSNIEFIFPTDRMIVHSTGISGISAHDEISWPNYGGTDYSRYGNWNHYLGTFVPDVESKPNYAGIFNYDESEGLVRRFPKDIATGSKLFAHSEEIPVSTYTRDGGDSYIEIWGGLTPTFWDSTTINPGKEISWTESWEIVENRGDIG